MKRLNFLHYLLSLDKQELLSRFFRAQIKYPGKGDWCLVVKEDLKSLNLETYTFDSISGLNKDTWKKIVKEKCIEKALTDLNMEKKSKLRDLVHKELKLQTYLASDKISIRNKKLLFSLRSRTLKLGYNYGSPGPCRLCEDEEQSVEETQQHIIACVKIREACQESGLRDAKYDDIFTEDETKLKTISELYRKAWETRELLLMEKDNNSNVM